MEDFYKVCVKLYASEVTPPSGDADLFVPIFHEWIRDGDLDLISLDVADYAHVPDGPGIMLITHETAFALDRSDGRFGLLAQRRTPLDGDGAAAVASTLRDALKVAARLEADFRLADRLRFDRSEIRIEANDRLRAPNSDAGFRAFGPVVREGLQRAGVERVGSLRRIENEPRDRLALEARVAGLSLVSEVVAP
ncbi:MAG: hypothetical protein GEU90_09455 [Gemmatimonas sp.]|nr:hypothetical protein [Gemmatimonas sp.]